ncbi:MAG: type III-A CRISPR-associated RAMP protein Csm4 [Candidatus Kapaibacteriota bacterium]
MKAIYLFPRSSFVTELRSDTLWGLIAVAIGYVFSEKYLIDFIEKYLNGGPPFLISSAMPFEINKDTHEKVHYFPKPLFKSFKNNFSSEESKENIENRKKLKKCRYIPQSLFEELISGERQETDIPKEWLDNPFKLNDSLNLHNTIDPMTGSTLELEEGGQLYYTREFFLDRQHQGLFFLADGKDLSLLDPALRFLTHFGFGGDNSTGKGSFHFDIQDFTLQVPENPDYFVTLSLYNPELEELSFFKEDRDKLFYELTLRRGIIGSQFKKLGYEKKPYFAFSEGSTFPFVQEKNYLGRLLQTMEVPKAYSYAFAFPIPARFKE